MNRSFRLFATAAHAAADYPTIQYNGTATDNPIARLRTKLDSGAVRLGEVPNARDQRFAALKPAR